jgi:hemin uptake protein HemP
MVRISVYTVPVNPSLHTPPQSSSRPTDAAVAAPRLAFADLSSGRREVFIEHAGQVYRLSLTALNKLILTK